MSVKVMGRVWDSTLPPNLRLVLLAYADAAEHDGSQSYPGWERLVEMTGYSRSTIEAITKTLRSIGVLVQVRKGHVGQRAEFRIDLGKLAALAAPEVSQSETLSDSGVSEPETHEVSQSETQPKPESVRSDGVKVSDPSDTSRPDPSSKSDLLPTVVDHAVKARDDIWDALIGTGFETPTNDNTRGRRNKAVKLLRQSGATPDQIRARTQAWPFHFPDATLTDIALANHWDELGRPPARASSTDVQHLDDVRRRRLEQDRARELEELRGRGLNK
jgi:hypothetical protein